MTDISKYLVRTSEMGDREGYHISHPMQADTEIFWSSLSDKVGMQRAHLNIGRIPPAKAAFPVHFHAIQEEFVFVLSGAGTARIGDENVAIGPGDYIGFPVDGTPHGIRNTGNEDLVCLMGGERTDAEVATFPELGKVAIQGEKGMTFHEIEDGKTRPMSDWMVED